MTIARTGGATSVYVVEDADLKVNGGQFRLQDGGAIPVHANRLGPIGRRPIRGGDAIPVYVVNSTQLSGPGQKFKLIKGHPRLITDIIGTARGVKGGTAIPVFPATYADKVLLTQSANLIAYWPLWETSGGIADDESGNSRLGIYSAGITLGQPGIGDGRTSPLFDGANDFVNIYSASLNTAFNGSEGTAFLWIRVSGAGVWTDGSERRIVTIRSGGANRLYIAKQAVNNRLIYVYVAGGVNKTREVIGITDTGWMTIALTWSATADEVKAYLNGVQIGATFNALGIWVGNLSATLTNIGSQSNAPASVVWDGLIAHVQVRDTALSGPEILNLATL